MKDAIENLAKAYLDIRREGCIQFDDLLVVVHCDQSHSVGIELRLQSIGEVMQGRNVKNEMDALMHCQALYRFLNQCVSKWQDIMAENRRQVTVCTDSI